MKNILLIVIFFMYIGGGIFSLILRFIGKDSLGLYKKPSWKKKDANNTAKISKHRSTL